MDWCARMLKTHEDGALVDWRQLREELRKARSESGKSLRQLKADAGIDPSTVHRIENVKRYPDYQPDLDTLDALTRAMGLSLAVFFGRIEGLRPALSQEGSTVAHAAAGDPTHASNPAERATLREIANLKSRIERLETALSTTTDVAQQLGELAATGAKGRATPIGTSGRRRRD